MTGTTELPTEGEYDTAIEKLDKVYGSDAEAFISMIETVRDDETFHDTNPSGGARACLEDCKGCLTELIADAITCAVNGR